jgi:hypothetical protein
MEPAPRQQRPQRPRNRKRGAIVGGACLLGGLALAYYGFANGFEVPGVQGPYRSEIVFDGPPAAESAGEPDWSVIGPGAADIVKVATEPRPSPERTTGAEPGEPDRPTASRPSERTVPSEGTSTPTAVRVHVPSGWHIAKQDEGYVEIRPDDDPDAAYVAFYTNLVLEGDIDSAHAAYVEWSKEGLPAGLRTEHDSGPPELADAGFDQRWSAHLYDVGEFEQARVVGTLVKGGRLLLVVVGMNESDDDKYGDAMMEAIRRTEF